MILDTFVLLFASYYCKKSKLYALALITKGGRRVFLKYTKSFLKIYIPYFAVCPFEKISRNQDHRVKVLLLIPSPICQG